MSDCDQFHQSKKDRGRKESDKDTQMTMPVEMRNIICIKKVIFTAVVIKNLTPFLMLDH